jgi:uncharacterized protein
VDDRAVVEWQLDRPLRAFRRVARRCPHGFPAVTEQAPRAEDGTPFPTTYWLTCPWLRAALARIEAAGGVRRWLGAAASDPVLGASLARAHASQRRQRPELEAGIAGSVEERSLKCLHAHAAFALALPGYELGDRILAEVDEPWCPDARCSVADRAASS